MSKWYNNSRLAFLPLFALVFSSLLFFSGCQNKAPWQERQVAQIDSLLLEVDTLQQKFNRLQSDQNQEKLEEIRSLYNKLGRGYADSSDKQFWMGPMEELYLMEKSYRKFLEKSADKEKELQYTGEQLQDLKKTILQEKLSPEEGKKYLKDEQNALQQSQFWMRKRGEMMTQSSAQWDSTEAYYRQLEANLPKSEK